MISISGGGAAGGGDLWDSGPLFSCQLKPHADFTANTGQLRHRRVNTTFHGALPAFLLTQEQQLAILLPPPPQAHLLVSAPHS